MAIVAGVTASPVDRVNVGVFVAPPVPNVLATLLDHVEDPPPDPEPELGEDSVRDTWCDAVSSVMAAGFHEALGVQPAACWYQNRTREMIDA